MLTKNKEEVSTLISDKIDFKNCKKRQRRLYNGKRTIHQEDITIVNVYAPNKATKYIMQKLTEPKEGINNNTVIVRNFNTPFLTMDRSSRQRINKETANLKTL